MGEVESFFLGWKEEGSSLKTETLTIIIAIIIIIIIFFLSIEY